MQCVIQNTGKTHVKETIQNQILGSVCLSSAVYFQKPSTFPSSTLLREYMYAKLYSSSMSYFLTVVCHVCVAVVFILLNSIVPYYYIITLH